MQFTTPINIPEGKPKISHTSGVLLLGSCFAENIGGKFLEAKFESKQNPIGILFHPFAIASFLRRVAKQELYTTADTFCYQEVWSSFSAHSRLNSLSQAVLLTRLNTALQATRQFLSSATHVIITLGTSWVYRHKESGQYVANCHKIPQVNFVKEIASPTAIAGALQKSLTYLKEINPDIHVIYTVSPVRHLKDGLVENQQSKAHLLTALYQFLSSTQNTFYFPAYEIVLDELRDYRYYTADMLHPNSVAVNYIWEKFIATWISEDAALLMKKIDKIQRAVQHKAFNEDSEQHQLFLKKLESKIATLQQEHPFIKFNFPLKGT